MSDLKARTEAFLYREARLMDEHQYEAWLGLFADECRYWIPSNREDADPAKEVSILYGDRTVLATHVQRLTGGKAYAQSPPSRLRRIVSNVEIVAPSDGAVTESEFEVLANFVIFEIRRHTQRIHAGQSRYRLTSIGDDFVIRYKQVNLVGLDEPQENITFLL